MPWQVGTTLITRVVDLDFPLPSKDPVPEWCVPDFAPTSAEVSLAFSAFLVTGAGPPLVIDPWLANDGPRHGDDADATARRLLGLLEGAGALAEEVRLVVNTHLDGIGWNTRPGPEDAWVAAFPNARYAWPAANLAFHGEDDRLAPLQEARVVDPVALPIELAPGVTLDDGPGHEPGHGVVWVRSMDQVACITGHLFISPLQIADPSLGFDEDPVAAEQTRRRLLTDLTACDGLLLSPLLGGPGGGRVRADGEAWRLVPA